MEDRLLKAYIGNKATEIINNTINWRVGLLSMFLGPIWFFYRKAWLPGIAYIFIAYLLNKFDFFTIERIAIILGSITIFFANKIYIYDARKKVHAIIKNNRGAGEDEILELVKEKGGTSIVLTIFYIIALIGLLIVIATYYISQYGYVFDRLNDTLNIINRQKNQI